MHGAQGGAGGHDVIDDDYSRGSFPLGVLRPGSGNARSRAQMNAPLPSITRIASFLSGGDHSPRRHHGADSLGRENTRQFKGVVLTPAQARGQA